MPKKKDFNDLIKLYNIRHKNKYDYSKAIYLGINLDICIQCPIHGEFLQTADSHKLYGCPKCGEIKRNEYYKKCSNKYSTDVIKEYIKSIGNHYIINLKEEYEYNSIDFISVFCAKHNIENKYQIRKILSRKSFCNQCKYINRSIISSKPQLHRRITFSEFIDKTNNIFPKGFYSFEKLYGDTDFLISDAVIKVTCHRHNLVFIRKATNIINNKCACYVCNKSISGPERIIWKELDNRHIQFEFQKVFDGLKIGRKKYLKTDFYIPIFNLVIEYNGEQHYKPLKRGQNISDDEALERFNNLKQNDKIKYQYCINNLINIEIITYKQKNIKKILSDLIIKYETRHNKGS